MEIARTVSTIILWILIGLYIYLIRCNCKIRKDLIRNIELLTKAKKNCDDAANKFNDALTELRANGIEAANAVLIREEEAAE